MIKETITKLLEKKDLSESEMHDAMQEIMSGGATPAQIASFLTVLRIKGESVDEISAAAEVMRNFATKIRVKNPAVLDTCGTGGDGAGTFNVSTLAALVSAGAGAVVAKHGNRCVSSKCGSADLLEALGVNIQLKPEDVEKSIEQIGIGFLFAQLLHGAMRYAAPVRREMGIRTIFNILGPLTNPASAAHQLLGVYSKTLVSTLAKVLKNLGAKHALVVHGSDGLDEVTTTGATHICELKKGSIKNYKLSPSEFGIKKAKPKDIAGGDAAYNAALAKEVLKGKKGPARDIVVLNSGCALYAADMAKTIKEGIKQAAHSIDSGNAMDKLNKLIEFSKSRAA
ncbi:MAG: anthranilate phosphoribosyltransferase [Candidatus Omnitrophota bacterium]